MFLSRYIAQSHIWTEMFQANPRIFANANSALSMLSNPEANILQSAGTKNLCRCSRQTFPSDTKRLFLSIDEGDHDHGVGKLSARHRRLCTKNCSMVKSSNQSFIPCIAIQISIGGFQQLLFVFPPLSLPFTLFVRRGTESYTCIDLPPNHQHSNLFQREQEWKVLCLCSETKHRSSDGFLFSLIDFAAFLVLSLELM